MRSLLATVLVSAGLACLTFAPGALAADQFTLDPMPDSIGPVVTDAAGNGYVAWEHASSAGGADVPMFCRLVPGAHSCAHPIALSLPDPADGSEASALAPFPILGPGATVWVAASRYVMDDTLVWTSSDGGATFGPPYQIPYVPDCSNGGTCQLSFSFANHTGVDDMLPVTPSYATYDRQLYPAGGGAPSVGWLEATNNPGLGFNFDDTAETAGGPEGATEFSFSNTGAGGVTGSALGTTATGDVVEAYSLLTSPPTLAYYPFNAPTADPVSPQTGWSGPTVIGHGDAPRLSDGAAGLFMLSADSSGTGQANLIDVRQYSTASHSFGAAHTLGKFPASAGSLFGGGGLGENYDTGELAAAWPSFA